MLSQIAYFGSPFKAPGFFSEAVKEASIEVWVVPLEIYHTLQHYLYHEKVPVKQMNNPADTIMDILANETAQEAILSYYKQSGDADAVCKAMEISRITDEGASKR